MSEAEETKLPVERLLNALLESPFNALAIQSNPDLQKLSLFTGVADEIKEKVLQFAKQKIDQGGEVGIKLSRAIGSMCGMAIADSLGHHFEFETVQDALLRTPRSPWMDATGAVSNKPYAGVRVGQFMLQPGQWTDDASMGLCLADR